MNIKRRIVVALVRLYPSTWRNEYGPELTDMLLTRPLGAGIIADVLRSGLLHRVRSVDASTALGLVMMLVILGGLAWNVMAPRPYGQAWTGLLQPSLKTLPTITVKPLASELYVLFLMGSACWIQLRHGGDVSRSGIAAARICFIAGIPIVLAGVLMLSGILGVAVLGPGDTPSTLHEHGFALTYYSALPDPPAPLSVLVSPLFRLPESWLWGMVGGWIGRAISRLRHSLATSS